MRLLERFSIIFFSIIVFILSIMCILLATDVISTSFIDDIAYFLNENIIATICISLIMCLWAIANIFFKSDNEREISNGVLLENENGSLLITKESISSLVETVLKKIQDLKESSVKIEFDSNKDIVINLNAVVKDSAVIKDISTKIQEEIKQNVKRATDLEVSSINIKIKSVEAEKKQQVQ